MKKILLVFIFLSSFAFVHAQDYKTGAGARVGDGISATLKHFLDNQKALEVIMGFEDGTSIIGVLTFHKPLSKNQERLKWYFGGGAYFLFLDKRSDNTFIGIAGAIGAEYTLPNKKFAFSMDWNPALTLVGDIDSFNGRFGGVTIRYIIN